MPIIKGMDIIPIAVYQNYKLLFDKYLPKWTPNAAHNLQPGAAAPQAAALLTFECGRTRQE